MQNELVLRTKVSWTLDEDATKTIAIPIPSGGPHDSGIFAVAVSNGSAVVDLAVRVDNKFKFDGTNVVAATLVAGTDFAVTKGTAGCKIVDGLCLGEGSQLVLSKSAATAAAFTAYVEIRKA